MLHFSYPPNLVQTAPPAYKQCTMFDVLISFSVRHHVSARNSDEYIENVLRLWLAA